MTTRDDVLAALDAYVNDQTAAATAAQASADQATIDGLNATITADQATISQDQATIADLQAQLAAAQQPATPPAAVFGANCGGYSGEDEQHAFQRINGHWQLGMYRWWANQITKRTPPSFIGDIPVCVEWDADPAAISDGSLDAQMAAAFATYKPGDVISVNHEFDIHGNIAANVAAIQRFSDRCKLDKPDGVLSVLILTVGSYIGGARLYGAPWDQCWPSDPSGIDLVGSDTYQHGTSDTNADTAAYVLNPVYAAAQQLGGKPVIHAEFAARSGGTSVTDAGRAKFITDSIAIMRANPTHAALYYESYKGSLGPWNLLETSATSAVCSPKAAAVWADACAA